VDKRNRRSQAEFSCLRCGHTCHADLNAASVLAQRAVVSRPDLSRTTQRAARLRVVVAKLRGFSPSSRLLNFLLHFTHAAICAAEVPCVGAGQSVR
jgi:hypothetical protein